MAAPQALPVCFRFALETLAPFDVCVTLLLIIAFLSFNCNLIKDKDCVFGGLFLGDQPSSAACPAET